MAAETLFLDAFLNKHKLVKEDKLPITHMRMNGGYENKYPASYHIPEEKMSDFYRLYYKEVFINKKNEFLTEKQCIETGALMVDLDLKYDYSTMERQYKEDDINRILYGMMEQISKIVEIPENVSIYVFEKTKVNRVKDKNITKDGLHFKIDLSMNKSARILFRKNLIEWFSENMTDWNLANTWEDVVDAGILMGTTGWQVYGSKKPHHEAYKWTAHLEYALDEETGEYCIAYVDEDPSLGNSLYSSHLEKLKSLCARTPASHHPVIRSDCILPTQTRIIRSTTTAEGTAERPTAERTTIGTESGAIPWKITSMEELEKEIGVFLNSAEKNTRDWVEVNAYIMVLPEKYYESGGSHLESRKVAFSFKDKDPIHGFLFWVKLRTRSKDFRFEEMEDLWHEWKRFHDNHPQPIRFASFFHWVKMDISREEYTRIHESSLAFLIEKTFHTIERATDFDLAMILYELNKHKYVVTEDNIWYVLEDHRWVEDPNADSLRKYLSISMSQFFEKLKKEEDRKWLSRKKEEEEQDQETEPEDGGGEEDGDTERESGLEAVPSRRRKTTKKENNNTEKERYQSRCNRILNTCNLLKNNTSKNKIMAEVAVLFRDSQFNKRLNANGWLMGFKNGVVDFEQGIFRPGKPEDYLTFQTGHEYFELTEENNAVLLKKIDDFFNKIFPVRNERGEYAMKEYVLDFLAACLIGVKKDNLFLIWYGSGSNGKSILDELMKQALGDYYQVVPTQLFTGEAPKLGGTCSELAALKGKRFVIGSEMKKGMVCNEASIKNLSGGGEIIARDLHKKSETFYAQFYMILQTNNLLIQESNDDGIWRRLKVTEFLSKFYKPGEAFEDATKYKFLGDDEMKTIFPKQCAAVFINFLVQRAFRTKGTVVDCEEVKQATARYRREQNIYASYFEDRLCLKANHMLLLSEIKMNFKNWVDEVYQGCKPPKIVAKELEKYLNSRLGDMETKRKGWNNIAFQVNNDEDADADDDEH